MLFKTALKKQSPVIADEILNLIEENFLEIEEVINTLTNTKSQIILTGNKLEKNIENLTENIIEFIEIKK